MDDGRGERFTTGTPCFCCAAVASASATQLFRSPCLLLQITITKEEFGSPVPSLSSSALAPFSASLSSRCRRVLRGGPEAQEEQAEQREPDIRHMVSSPIFPAPVRTHPPPPLPGTGPMNPMTTGILICLCSSSSSRRVQHHRRLFLLTDSADEGQRVARGRERGEWRAVRPRL